MAKMPEIVRSRLAQKTGENSAHPDANVLTAFAEHALLEHEREAVVAHLINCADCRETVALTFASAEPEMPTAVKPVAGFGGWVRQWRVFASATAVCSVIAGALLYYGQPPARVALVRNEQKVIEPQVAGTITPEAVASSAQPVAKKKFVPPRSNKTIAAQKVIGAAEILTQPPAAQPAADTASAFQRLQEAKTEAAPPLAEPPQETAVARALPRPSQRAGSAKLFGGQSFAQGARAETRAKLELDAIKQSARVLWSINASASLEGSSRGTVEHSVDGGQSWQAVPLSEHISFRAVANFGPDVWAGGSAGSVFHSPDAGEHWSEVEIADDRGRISGDVVQINVRGPNHVTIATASGEIWTSGDGRHWARQ